MYVFNFYSRGRTYWPKHHEKLNVSPSPTPEEKKKRENLPTLSSPYAIGYVQL